MTAPAFSVVIPCYNRAETVLPTLKSVQDQTFADFECLVVDDGSADGAELAAVVAGLGDARFRLIRRDNGGGGAARNTGIEAARGRWIAFLDSDDLFLPEKLAAYAAQITDDTQTVWYSQNLVDRGVGRFWVRPPRAIKPAEALCEYLFVQNCFIQTSTIVLTRDLAQRVGFDPSLRKGQDLDFCIRLAAAGARFIMLPEPQSIWVDLSEQGRTSRHAGHAAPQDWLARLAPLLTRRAVRGYRATILAYYMAGERPLTAARYILEGWLLAGVPLRITLRQGLRCFLPRQTYRKLVDGVVRLRGAR